jgi:hypothetical protein
MTTDEKPVRPAMMDGRFKGVVLPSNNPVMEPINPSPVRSRSQSAQNARRALPSSFSSSVAPPTPAIKHVLQWALSTESGEMSARFDMLAQAILSKIASTPNEWFDLSKTMIKFDILPDILSRVTDGSSDQKFSNFGLTLERDGNKVRFARSE